MGAVAVIDGKILKLTPFRPANVPPPMALYEVPIANNIIDVAYNYNSNSIAILHHDGIALYDWKIKPKSSSPPTLIGQLDFDKSAIKTDYFQQICFGLNNSLLTLKYTQTGEPVISAYRFDSEAGRVVEENFEHNSQIQPSLVSSFTSGDPTIPFAQDTSGALYSLASGSPSPLRIRFPTLLPWVEIIKHDDEYTAFGLSGNGHLYANSRLLVKNCTSFLLTPAHLVFTTTTHLLKFVHISKVEGEKHYFFIFMAKQLTIISSRSSTRRPRKRREMSQYRTWSSTCDSYANLAQCDPSNAKRKSRDNLATSDGCSWHSNARRGKELPKGFLSLPDPTS